MAEETYTAILSVYEISPQQAKEHLLGLSRNPCGSVSDFGVEIGHLVALVHPYLPTTERDLLTIEYLMRSPGNKHLLTADTSIVASTVHAIESYLAIENAGRLACKVTRGEVENNHLEKVVGRSPPNLHCWYQRQKLWLL